MPKLVNFSELNTLGVINITPNSFSDPKLNLNPETLKATIQEFLTFPNLVFDFGFESTAPMNSAISYDEERARYDTFFETIEDIDLSGRWISFDTYRPENYLYFESKFKSRYHGCGYIFNDVSGVIDQELLDLLKSKKDQENFYYIYAHTHIPSRELVLNHMNFIRQGDIVQICFNHFMNGLDKIEQIGFRDKVILDPCFGFSKSYDQNWDLLDRFSELTSMIEKNNKNVPWLIGISKKSFLRKKIIDSIDPIAKAEILHEEIIKKLLAKKICHLLFRVHAPLLVTRQFKEN